VNVLDSPAAAVLTYNQPYYTARHSIPHSGDLRGNANYYSAKHGPPTLLSSRLSQRVSPCRACSQTRGGGEADGGARAKALLDKNQTGPGQPEEFLWAEGVPFRPFRYATGAL
jgi:hypothetical protein